MNGNRGPFLGLLPALLATAIAACGGGGDDGGGGALAITTTAAEDGVVGAAYSETIVATGGRGAKTFSLSAGTLPPGLTLNAGGVISGTPEGPAGRADFTVSVSDSATTPATDTQALSIDIVEPLVLTTAALPDPDIGVAYAQTLDATGGTPPYAFAAIAGLPSGLALATGGDLTGTPTNAATTGTLTVRVTDSSSPALTDEREYRLTVPLSVATTALADAAAGAPYTDALQARGGLPPYAWTLLGGALPAGLTLGADGIVAGTPPAACAAATTVLQVQVVDADTPAQSDVRGGIDLAVNPAPLAVETASLPAAVVGAAYNQRIVATGGVPPYAFALTGGVLPSQLSLGAGNGRITGTPDTLETQAFEVTVTDACPNTASRDLSLTVNAAVQGRNDSIAQATALPGNGSYAASISPSGHPNTQLDPDEDYYRIDTGGASTITVDIVAQDNGSALDSVIEIVNAAGAVLNQCGAPAFVSACVNDDEIPGSQLDSRLELSVNGATTFYIHVVDWGSIARPDQTYDLVISGVN